MTITSARTVPNNICHFNINILKMNYAISLQKQFIHHLLSFRFLVMIDYRRGSNVTLYYGMTCINCKTHSHQNDFYYVFFTGKPFNCYKVISFGGNAKGQKLCVLKLTSSASFIHYNRAVTYYVHVLFSQKTFLWVLSAPQFQDSIITVNSHVKLKVVFLLLLVFPI